MSSNLKGFGSTRSNSTVDMSGTQNFSERLADFSTEFEKSKLGPAPRNPRLTGAMPDRETVVIDEELSVTALTYAAPRTTSLGVILLLAHGAGGNQNSPFMVQFASGLSALGLRTITFNFLYTEAGRRVPDRTPKLETCYRAVVRWVGNHAEQQPIFIGGKSMGARIASQVAAAPRPEDEAGTAAVDVAGVVALGYPLHPPGRPNQLRDSHLPRVATPMLVVQGSRDRFGTEAELRPVVARMPSAELYLVEGGDHSLKVHRRSDASPEETSANVMREIVRWVTAVVGCHRTADRGPALH